VCLATGPLGSVRGEYGPPQAKVTSVAEQNFRCGTGEGSDALAGRVTFVG